MPDRAGARNAALRGAARSSYEAGLSGGGHAASAAEPGREQARLLQAVREFETYLRATAERIPGYGERRRVGEAISTAFTESAVNQVVSKRMIKKQQMRWTPRGAHLLLQAAAPGTRGHLKSNGFRPNGVVAGITRHGSIPPPHRGPVVEEPTAGNY